MTHPPSNADFLSDDLVQVVIETAELKHGRTHYHYGEIVFLPRELSEYFLAQGWVRWLNRVPPPVAAPSKTPCHIQPQDGVLR